MGGEGKFVKLPFGKSTPEGCSCTVILGTNSETSARASSCRNSVLNVGCKSPFKTVCKLQVAFETTCTKKTWRNGKRRFICSKPKIQGSV